MLRISTDITQMDKLAIKKKILHQDNVRYNLVFKKLTMQGGRFIVPHAPSKFFSECLYVSL